MAVKLTVDNPLFTLKPTMQELVSPFLQMYGLNYFQYLRCYSDGSFGLLTNDTSLTEYFHTAENEPVIFSSYESTQAPLHSYWFSWDEKLPGAPVQMAREKCHLYHGITWVRRAKDYYDMIAVALPQERPDPSSFYLSILGAIESFVYAFDKDHRSLITVMDKNRIALPTPNRDVNYQSMCIASGKIPVIGRYGDTYITTQELACVRWLLQRLTYKEIARILTISPRTVETYVNRVKERTGCISQVELQALIRS